MSPLRLLAAAAMFFAAPAFAEEDTLTIGMTLSQTGSLNVDSVAQQRGAELWRVESPVVARLLTTLEQEPSCAFVGVFPTGLSFADDLRPDQERIEFWEGPVTPRTIEPGGDDWEARWQLHRAANAYHVARRLDQDVERRYNIAWVPCWRDL